MKIASCILLAIVLSIPWWCAAAPVSPAVSAANSKTATVTVAGDKTWVDTGMDVNAGDKLHITATGTVNMGNNTGVTPNGVQRGWVDTLRALTLPSAGRGALVGRIGNSDAATPFLIGADGTVLAPVAGRLYLGINQDSTQTPDGRYEVQIDRIAASAATASGAAAGKNNYDFQPVFATLDKKLPYRVTGKAGAGGNPWRPGQLRAHRLARASDQCVQGCRLASGRQDQHGRGCQRGVGHPAEESLHDSADEHSVSLRPSPGFRLRTYRAGDGGGAAQPLPHLECALEHAAADHLGRCGNARRRHRARPALGQCDHPQDRSGCGQRARLHRRHLAAGRMGAGNGLHDARQSDQGNQDRNRWQHQIRWPRARDCAETRTEIAVSCQLPVAPRLASK